MNENILNGLLGLHWVNVLPSHATVHEHDVYEVLTHCLALPCPADPALHEGALLLCARRRDGGATAAQGKDIWKSRRQRGDHQEEVGTHLLVVALER